MKRKALIAITTLGLALSTVTINVPFSQQVVLADNYESKRQELQNKIKNNSLTTLNLIDLRAAVKEEDRLKITGQYIELYLKQEGVKLQQQVHNHSKDEEIRQRVRFDLGMISFYDFERTTKDIHIELDNLKKQRSQLNIDIHKLLMDLEIEVNSNRTFSLREIPDSEIDIIHPVAQPSRSEIERKVENSKTIKRLRDQISDLENQMPVSSSQYTANSEDGPDPMELIGEQLNRMAEEQARRQLQAQIEALEKQIDQTKIELRKQFIQLYFEANEAYKDVKQAEREIEFGREDYHQLAVFYEVGLISKHDYAQRSLPMKQAEFKLTQAKMMYYLTQQQIKEL